MTIYYEIELDDQSVDILDTISDSHSVELISKHKNNVTISADADTDTDSIERLLNNHANVVQWRGVI